MELSDILNLISPVSPETVREFLSHCKVRRYQKGDSIVTQGLLEKSLFLVKEGVFRVGRVIDDIEDTICFGQRGDCFMSFHSFYAGEGAQFSCIAMTEVEAYVIDCSELEVLLSGYPDISRWFYKALSEELYLIEKRYVYFGAKDAATRFEVFIAARPDIVKNVPTKYIAQYLKIRPETLYRIRARYLRKL